MNDPDWQDEAKELYRAVQAELLERWAGSQPEDVESLKMDLQEALLDLKQAVIDDRQADGERYSAEAVVLLNELREQSQGGSNE